MRQKKLLIQTVSILLFITAFCVPANANSMENVFGLGIGMPYGGLGVNYELSLNDYFAPTVGVGSLPENTGWNVGLRLYYPGRDHKFRGRITALYGTNTVLERERNNSDSDYDTETGFSGGIGFNWRFGKAWAFDGDLFFAESDIPEGYEEKGGDVKFSLGFSYRF